MRRSLLRLVIFVPLSLAGCASTQRVPITVVHPAEIDMSAYRQVAISGIKGNMGQDFSDHLKELLIGSGQFKVVDRQQLQHILDQLKISQSDLADPRYRRKIGRLISGAVWLTGHAEGRVETQVKQEDFTRRDKDKKEITATLFTRTCTASGSGSVDVVSIETGEILATKILRSQCSDKASAEKAAPDCKNEAALLDCAQKQNVAVLGRALTPWSETKMVPFAKDKQIPQLEEGIRHAEVGELGEAVKIFQAAAAAAEENPKIKAAGIAKAYWNLGLTYEYSDRYDEAIAALKKAYLIGADKACVSEQQAVRQRQAEQMELKRQLGAK